MQLVVTRLVGRLAQRRFLVLLVSIHLFAFLMSFGF